MMDILISQKNLSMTYLFVYVEYLVLLYGVLWSPAGWLQNLSDFYNCDQVSESEIIGFMRTTYLYEDVHDLYIIALWVTVLQTFLTNKFLPTKILTKFSTKLFKQNFIKWCGTSCSNNFSSNEYFGFNHVKVKNYYNFNQKYYMHTSKIYFM